MMAKVDDYADLEIRISPGRAGKGDYTVELCLDNEQEFVGGLLDANITPWIASGDCDDNGKRLFSQLFADPQLRAAWTRLSARRPKRRIRLRLDAEVSELHGIPWELLREEDPDRNIAATAATPFSRYLAGMWQPGGPILKRPIAMLVAVANPDFAASGFKSFQAINVDEETALLAAATEGLDVELDILPQPCTLEALEEKLRGSFHILHFVGHGVFGSLPQSCW